MYFDYYEYIENMEEEAQKLKENESDILKNLRFFNKNMNSKIFKDEKKYFYYYNRDRI